MPRPTALSRTLGSIAMYRTIRQWASNRPPCCIDSRSQWSTGTRMMGPKRGRTNHQRHLRAVLDRRSGVTAASVADRTEAASVGTPHEWAPILPRFAPHVSPRARGAGFAYRPESSPDRPRARCRHPERCARGLIRYTDPRSCSAASGRTRSLVRRIECGPERHRRGGSRVDKWSGTDEEAAGPGGGVVSARSPGSCGPWSKWKGGYSSRMSAA